MNKLTPLLPYNKLNFVYSQPIGSAIMRQQLPDFIVNEHLGFTLSGEGEHVWLHIEKQNCNTQFLAKQLARCAGVKNMDVGYAGLKDRRAITRQWFSIYIRNHAEPDWSVIENSSVRILIKSRHSKKLKRGIHQGNIFNLILREVKAEHVELDKRLRLIRANGVPNYFGEQRFGINYSNLDAAAKMFCNEIKVKDRHKRSLYISAVRSMLFNFILSTRIEKNNWNRVVEGDAMMLSGRQSFFTASDIDSDLQARINEGDISPTGSLWGVGERPIFKHALEIENSVLANYSDWQQGLEKTTVAMMRRALVLRPRQMTWFYTDKNELELNFYLPRGAYATAVIREIFDY